MYSRIQFSNKKELLRYTTCTKMYNMVGERRQIQILYTIWGHKNDWKKKLAGQKADQRMTGVRNMGGTDYKRGFNYKGILIWGDVELQWNFLIW
jgi:hypothetical protein